MASQRPPAFRGRAQEREVLDRLLDDVRGGQSRALVVEGEAGVGKTALLRYAARQAAGFRVVQLAGVESEMELPYAGLHQLCAPMLLHLDALPEPQEAALRVAFGLTSGETPDRFLVALATLGLLAHFAEERPVLSFVDDAQWLDGASSQVLGFVARRLVAESVAIVFAVREGSDDGQLVGLPELRLEGLGDDDARALLATVVPGRLDERVRDRIIAETRGNPLALLELPRGMTSAELAGGFGLPGTGDLRGHIEERYAARLGGLPEDTQRLMLLAAADPVGDATLLWRAAQALGVERDAAAPAASEHLLEIAARVRFRHPLVRSAVYRTASASDRRAAHSALAAATDPDVDPDRRAWHRAHAASGTDEEVATELEQSAGRAQARGGLAAAAAFLERAASLTVDGRRRVGRTLAAAQVEVQAGEFDAALGLLAAAESEAPDELSLARVELLRGRVASASTGSEAPILLLKAARRLESLDVALARGTYLDAWGAALFAGYLAADGGTLADVSRAAIAAPTPAREGPPDVLLDGLATLTIDGRSAAAPKLRQAVDAFRGDEVSLEQWLQWGVLASSAAVTLWDFDGWDAVSTRQVELARASGALAPLSIALNGQGMIATWSGDFDTAAALGAEDDALKQATGVHIAPYGAMLLAAYAGRTEEASALIGTTLADSVARGEGLGVALARWTSAILHNALGRYEDALSSSQHVVDDTPGLYISTWTLVELIEAAVRSGNGKVADDAYERFVSSANAGDSDWALGLEARSGALLHDGHVAESLHREAIERLTRTRLRPDLARAHLLYGEWLRRENRRVDAREQLRIAHDTFSTMGAEAFAERARRELLATGEQVRKRREDTRAELTPQEEHIARLARDGRTNPEIGAELFISARTVEWHLRKVFTKLGITSRKGLQDALPPRERSAVSA
jgi:DNA-binding CsgD family transcriptional regulator